MGEARSAAAAAAVGTPAVQRLFLACRSSLAHLSADVSREGHIQPILDILNTMTAADVGLVPPLPCKPLPPPASDNIYRHPGGNDSPEASSSPSTSPHASSPSFGTKDNAEAARRTCGLPWWQDAVGRRSQRRPGSGSSSQAVRSRRQAWAPVTYLHIYEEEAFSIGIFFLPASACIPLHDHPGMSVLSRLLYGSLHVRALDWAPSLSPSCGPSEDVSSFSSHPFGGGLAIAVGDEVLEGGSGAEGAGALCPTRVLHPRSGGNIHAFTALSDCAILDVLTPPYAPGPGGRNCTYYRARRASGVDGACPTLELPRHAQDLYWLEPHSPPADFRVHNGRYSGPKVVATIAPKSGSRSLSLNILETLRLGNMRTVRPITWGSWKIPFLGVLG